MTKEASDSPKQPSNSQAKTSNKSTSKSTSASKKSTSKSSTKTRKSAAPKANRKVTSNPRNQPKQKTQKTQKKDEDKSTIGSIIDPWVSEETISGIFDRISDVTSSAYKLAKKTTGTSYKVGKAIIQSQDQLKLMVAAGESLKDLREVAGLTANELSDAINLKDKTLIEAVENGTATLSFELILRLSALLARNDPIPFILKYTRTYSPETWKLLDDWGAGRLPLQYERERKFINIYRSQDDARDLSDDGFNKVLEFSRQAFNMALHFVAEQELELSDKRPNEKDKAKSEAQEQAANPEGTKDPIAPDDSQSEES